MVSTTKGSSRVTQRTTWTRFIEFDRISADAVAEGRDDGRLLMLMSTSLKKSGKH